MNIHTPLHRPPHARIDHDAVHRATLKASHQPRSASLRRRRRQPCLPASASSSATN